MMNELQHHGIKGQKWGVRRFQNPDGSWTAAGRERYGKGVDPRLSLGGAATKAYNGTLKRGTKIYRITNNKNDTTYDNKKYVSLSKEDHKKWQNYIGDAYKRGGGEAYNVEYKTTKELKIADYQEVGKIFMEKMQDNMAKTKMINDTKYAANQFNYTSDDAYDMLSLNFAMQTETGKMFVQELMKKGYHGVQDRHGQNTSENPVIIFDPDKNLKRTKVSKY